MRGAESGPFQSTGSAEFRGAFARISGRKIDLERAGPWPTNNSYTYEAIHYLDRTGKTSLTRILIPANGYLPPIMLAAEDKEVFDYILRGSGQVIYQEKDPTVKTHGRFYSARYPSERFPENLRIKLLPGSRYAWRAEGSGLTILRASSPPLGGNDIVDVDLSKFDSTKDPFKTGFRRIASRMDNTSIPDYYDTDYYARALREALKKPTERDPTDKEIRQVEEVRLEEDGMPEKF